MLSSKLTNLPNSTMCGYAMEGVNSPLIEFRDFATAEGRGLDAVGAAPNLACDGLGVLR